MKRKYAGEPSVNIVNDIFCFRFAERDMEVFIDPCYDLIFECALDNLVQKVRR